MLSELTAVLDSNFLCRCTRAGADFLHSIEHVVTVNNFAEHDMCSVEMRCLSKRHEELRSIGVGTGVRHGQIAPSSMLFIKVLIREGRAVNRLTADTGSVSEISALSHEAWDDTVESGALEVEWLALTAHSFLTSAESTEILRGLRSGSMEVHNDATTILANTNVHINCGVYAAFCSICGGLATSTTENVTHL